MSALKFLDIGARKFRRQFAGSFGEQLHHRAVLQHDGADDRLGDAGAGNDDAVVLQQHGAAAPERARHAGTQSGAANEIDGVGIDVRAPRKTARPAGCSI